MAIRDEKGMIRGLVGSVIFRKWREINVIQGRPHPGKQTLATKVAAQEFGIASSTARMLRHGFRQAYYQCDPGMPNRLTCRVLKAIQAARELPRLQRDLYRGADLKVMEGFEFNTRSPLQVALPVKPEVRRLETGGLEIDIPGFQAIHDPGWKHSHKLRYCVYSFNFKQYYAELLEFKDLENTGALGGWQPQHLQTEVPLPAGTIIFVTLSIIRCMGGGNIEWSTEASAPDWSPCGILAAFRTEEDPEEVPMSTPERGDFRRAEGIIKGYWINDHLKYVLENNKSRKFADYWANLAPPQEKKETPGWPTPELGRTKLR